MDRQMVVDLIKKRAVECPKGKQRLWISRCFEITVRSDQMAVVDEYESYGDKDSSTSRAEMLHVGRSVVSLRDGQVVEEIIERGRAVRRRKARQ